MFYILSVLFAFIFSPISVGALCFPDPVLHVYLNDNILSWDPSINCEGTYYLVVIYIPNNGHIEFTEQVDETQIRVDSLDFCRTYVFNVFAIANGYIAPYSQILGTIQLPSVTNITVSEATISQNEKDIVFHWEVYPQYVHCVDNYQLLLWPEGSIAPEQITTRENQYTIKDAPGCMSYRMSVAAEHRSVRQLIYSFNCAAPPLVNTLSLVALSQGTNNINMTWGLESYAVNRCTVSALYVQGEQFKVSVPIDDGPQRRDVEVNLSELRANRMYYLSVTVENSAGISKPFQLAVQTLPDE